MSTGDKAKDVVQKIIGKAEAFVGEKTDDDELKAQAQKDLTMSEERLRAEKAKDAAGEK